MSEPQKEFRSEQYEFSEEHNRQINALANAMSVVATLMKVIGLVFVLFFGLLLMQAIQQGASYGPVIGVGAAMLVFLCIGFWTSGSAHSFRRIVESKNQDVWHLMNAVESLHKMYGLLRTIIVGSLILAVVGLAMFAFNALSK